MFITVKINKHKIITSIVILLVVVSLLYLGYRLIASRNTIETPGGEQFVNANETKEVLDFIKGFGWQVEPKVVETEEFTLPKEFDILYKRYNQYQKDIGLDLTPYLGKTVKRYTYKVLNYPTPEQYKGQTVYADVIVRGGKVIAGDIKTNEISGFMVSLKGRTFKEITGIEERAFK